MNFASDTSSCSFSQIIRQAIHVLDVMSFEFSSTFPRVCCTLSEEFLINSLFFCNLWIRISWPDEINITQWNRIWFFFRRVKFDSWFNVMTIKVFPSFCKSPKSLLSPSSSFVSPGWDSSLSPWDSPLRFSLLTVDSDCNNTADDPSLTRRTAHSAISLVVVRWFRDNCSQELPILINRSYK